MFNIKNIFVTVIFCLALLILSYDNNTTYDYGGNEVLTSNNLKNDVTKFNENIENTQKPSSESISYNMDNYSHIPFVTFLNFFLSEYDIKSISELKCGKWDYMRFAKISNETTYMCFDDDKENIQKNNEIFSNHNIHFQNIEDDLDIYEKKLQPADLLIVQDIFNNWPNHKIQNFLNSNMLKYKYIMFTHAIDDRGEVNIDIRSGESRGVDLERYPFNVANLKLVFKYNTTNEKEVLIQLYKNPEETLVEAHNYKNNIYTVS